MTETARVLSETTDHLYLTDVSGDATATAIASLHAMGSGTLAEFHTIYTSDAINREAINEPPDTRGTGPAAMYATARWLRLSVT